MKSSQNSTIELIAERAINDQTTICGSGSKIEKQKPKFQHLKKGNEVQELHGYSTLVTLRLDKVP